jgi:isopenicillin N synthase-like dioxygenase
MNMTTFPTIDLARLSPGADGREAALAELRRTFAGVGAFYLVGHGIAPEEADRILALTRRFFALPDAARRSIEMANSPHFRGYTAPGNEYTQGQPDWRE